MRVTASAWIIRGGRRRLTKSRLQPGLAVPHKNAAVPRSLTRNLSRELLILRRKDRALWSRLSEASGGGRIKLRETGGAEAPRRLKPAPPRRSQSSIAVLILATCAMAGSAKWYGVWVSK